MITFPTALFARPALSELEPLTSPNVPGNIIAVGGDVSGVQTELAWSVDGGETFIASSLAMGRRANCVAYNALTKAMIVGGGNNSDPKLYRTYGNDVWEQLTLPAELAAATAIARLECVNGRWILSANGMATIFYSDNDGGTWTEVSGASDILFNNGAGASFARDGYFLFAGSLADAKNRLIVSSDGQNFTNEGFGTLLGAPRCFAKYGNTWFHGANDSRVWRCPTADPTGTWSRTLEDFGSGRWTVAFGKTSGGTLLAYQGFGTNGWRTSTNDGVSWGGLTGVVFPTGSSVPRTGYQLGGVEGGRMVLGGDYGEIVWEDGGSLTSNNYNQSVSPFATASSSVIQQIYEVPAA